MKGLYARLRGIGLPTPWVRKMLLPDWWEDEAATKPAGFTEAVWTISRHLGVPADQLRDISSAITLPRDRGVQFKLTKGSDRESVDLARLLGEQVAKFALLGTGPFRTPIESARDTRLRVLESGAPWVGFGSLLDHCWSVGIPVLHLSDLPGRRMDGMVVAIDSRPAIVLASAKSAPWLLFHLAHELGHVALGHGAVVDADIDESSSDPQEMAANAFAIDLITGKAGMHVRDARWPKAGDLAVAAQQLGRQECIDPGHLVLSYAHAMSRGANNNFWGVANAALKLLPSEGDAVAMIRDRMAANLDWSCLPGEAAEFVARMTACPR
jgi:hypothetical protein